MDPVDLSRLASQVPGDAGLRREVLRLFADQAPAQFRRLKQASGAARRAVAHQIVGSARAVGADEVARLAAAIEAGRGDAAALEAAIDAARKFIARHLAD